MNCFREYPSNTYAGSCNNYMLFSEEERTVTGRMLFRICDTGTLPYRFFFCNAVDSTFSDGKKCRSNTPGAPYEILSAAVGTCPAPLMGQSMACDAEISDLPLTPLTFDGSVKKLAASGESYWSDEITLSVSAAEYLVFEWTVRGTNIPYTPDKKFPCYVRQGMDWKLSNECPQPCMIGAKRAVARRVGFWGDSITQGLQTRDDAYEFWVADIGRHFPTVSVWNLGLGFGRCEDSATGGVWFEKARQLDFVSLCFGVNDTREFMAVDPITANLHKTVMLLKEAGVGVGIMTIPPCDYNPEREKVWRGCNDYIRRELAKECVYCFDTVKYWGLTPPNDHISRFHAHPSGVGCALLADAFSKECSLL